MKTIFALLVLCSALVAQTSSVPAGSGAAEPSPTQSLTIPAGARIPLSLKQAISTKTAKEGDPVYAETTFPFVLNDRIVIPAGTYVQGKISRTERGGHQKGRAQLLIHFTSMIYPTGYTVMLGGAVENAPGTDKASVKDSEGTIQQDSDNGRTARDAAGGATTGAVIGAISAGGTGAGIGAGVGGLAGAAVGVLTRASDVRLGPGTSIEMEIQRAVSVDANRITVAQSSPQH